MTEPFRLGSVAIENFKAVRRSGSVKLTPLTVFIGNNGSGKSSLIEALATYRAILLDGLDVAMERWHGMDHILNRRTAPRRRSGANGIGEPEKDMLFELKGRCHAGRFHSRLKAGLEAGGNRIRITEETFELPTEEGCWRRDENGWLDGRRAARGVKQVTRSQILPGESVAPHDWIWLVRRWQFLALTPQPMGEPSPQRRTGGPPMLNRDGSNLGQYLWSLREASVDVFNELLEALKYVLPYARDVQPTITQEIERLIFLEMTEENFKVPGWLLSTGTLRILALLACLRHPDPPPLLVVEEIENGLDPRAIHLLVQEFRAAIDAKKTQILVTTHSPYLLDLLDLSQIVVVERVEGEPVFRRPDRVRLAEWSRSFAPGRLYTMGRLTGNS
ncbi:MAG: AAA family ATPase [Isosphaeraceae bacterium]